MNPDQDLEILMREIKEPVFDSAELLNLLEESKIRDSKTKIYLKSSIDLKKEPKLVSCVHCGKQNLYWYTHPGTERRLFCSETDEPHSCEGYRFLHRIQKQQIKEFLQDKERKNCKFCKEKNLYWIEESEGDWRLYDSSLRVHECLQYWKFLETLGEN